MTTAHVVVTVAVFVVGWLLGMKHGRDEGSVQVLIVVALALSGNEESARELHERLLDRGRTIRLGNLYPLLRDLERMGLVISREVPGSPARAGRPLVVYRIAKGGR